MKTEGKRVIAQFVTTDGEKTGKQLEIPLSLKSEELKILINRQLDNEEPLPYSFFVDEQEITSNLGEALKKASHSGETVVPIIYQPQAVFRVYPVARCTASMPGHTEAILTVAFSPDGKHLATGSGDTTVRLWDLQTQTAYKTLSGHKNWVLTLAWSPDGQWLASGGMDKFIHLWDSEGKLVNTLKGHRQWITALAWEPLHKNIKCSSIASASKDGTIKIWDRVNANCLISLNAHSASVTCLRWGGLGLLYTASQDRSVKVWNDNGKLVKVLTGHAHWVNSMALSTDFALRTGAFDHTSKSYTDPEEAKKAAQSRFNQLGGGVERLVTGSDDFTLFLWDPLKSKKPITRMTGHQQLVNVVSFSPDGRTIASASFDKSIRLWDGLSGKFIHTLRGHVGSVYQIAWSSDSRMLVSGSKDSTLKLWDMRKKALRGDLPGHADEVYAVDWSPDGQTVASGSKDRLVKLWRR